MKEDGVFKSTDAGATWARIGEVITYALAIDPITPGALYAGTYGGVFKSTDAGATWGAASTGLANSFITALALSQLILIVPPRK